MFPTLHRFTLRRRRASPYTSPNTSRFRRFFSRFFRKLKFSAGSHRTRVGSAHSGDVPLIIVEAPDTDAPLSLSRGSISTVSYAASGHSICTKARQLPAVRLASASSNSHDGISPSAREREESEGSISTSIAPSLNTTAASVLSRRILYPPPSLELVGAGPPTPSTKADNSEHSRATASMPQGVRNHSQRNRTRTGSGSRRKEPGSPRGHGHTIRPLQPPPWHYRLRHSRAGAALSRRSISIPELQFCSKHSKFPCTECKVR